MISFTKIIMRRMETFILQMEFIKVRSSNVNWKSEIIGMDVK